MFETDERIYSRYLEQGREEDLRVLLERHREGLILFLIGYVRSEEDAEELMMDAFAVAASGVSPFSGRSSFRTWLYGIARNRAKMFLRKKKGLFYSLDDQSEPETSGPGSPELSLLRKEEDRELYLALESLPRAYRQVLFLLYFEGMDAQGAALVMGKTRKQIYNLTQRGRVALREALERMGFDDAHYR